MGTRKNGAHEGDTRGERDSSHFSRVSFSRASFFRAPITSKRLVRRLDTRRRLITLKRICMPVRTGITELTQKSAIVDSMAGECRLLKNWTGLRIVPTGLTTSPYCFTVHIFEKYNGIDELQLIFARLVSFNFTLRTPFNRC